MKKIINEAIEELMTKNEFKYLKQCFFIAIDSLILVFVPFLLLLFINNSITNTLYLFSAYIRKYFAIFIFSFILAEIHRFKIKNKGWIYNSETYIENLFCDTIFGENLNINFIFLICLLFLSFTKNFDKTFFYENKDIFIMIQGTIISFIVSINFSVSYTIFNRKTKWQDIKFTFVSFIMHIITAYTISLRPNLIYFESKNLDYLYSYYFENSKYIKGSIKNNKLDYFHDFFIGYINCLKSLKTDKNKKLLPDNLESFKNEIIAEKDSVEYLLKMISFSSYKDELYINLIEIYNTIKEIETFFSNKVIIEATPNDNEYINQLIDCEINLLNDLIKINL